MDRADLDGIELEYELVGSGEPVVLIHAGCCAAWFAPLLEQQELDFVKTVAQPALARYDAGDTAGAVDTWMRGVCAPDYREAFDAALPDALEQGVADGDTFFGQELPAVRAWSFTEADAKRIPQATLAVVGANSRETFRERRELLLEWLPNVEPFDLPATNHLLHVQNPGGAAKALTAFFARHPI